VSVSALRAFPLYRQAYLGIDGARHRLSDYDNAAAVVLVFLSRCPISMAYVNRIVALQDDYRQQGVQLIAIGENKGKPPSDQEWFDGMKEQAAKCGFTFPYLQDTNQQLAAAFGVKIAPHVFLFDRSGKLVYQGALDDNKSLARVKRRYLRDALDAVLAGRDPEPRTTKPFG
jgi:peroxiredoxin